MSEADRAAPPRSLDASRGGVAGPLLLLLLFSSFVVVIAVVVVVVAPFLPFLPAALHHFLRPGSDRGVPRLRPQPHAFFPSELEEPKRAEPPPRGPPAVRSDEEAGRRRRTRIRRREEERKDDAAAAVEPRDLFFYVFALIHFFIS